MSWYLPRLVDVAKALELLLFSPTMTAQEALALGLVTEVVAPEELTERAYALATRLAEGPTLAYQRIKQLVRSADRVSLAEGLADEYKAVAETGASRDHDLAIRALLAK